MRNKFAYSCSIKSVLQDLMNSWKAFSASCWVGKHFPCKVVKMLEEVVIRWQEVRWIWRVRQNFAAQLSKHCLCSMCSGIVTENNWALSVDQCQLQALQFSVQLINLLSILFKCNGFARIQKALVDQTSRRPPNSDHYILVQVWLWEVLWSFFSVQPLSHCRLSYKIHFLLHVTVWSRNGLLLLHRIRGDNTWKQLFWLSASSWGTHYQAFSPFQFASNTKWLYNDQGSVLQQLLK